VKRERERERNRKIREIRKGRDWGGTDAVGALNGRPASAASPSPS
jgi:hypothetical protein